MSDAAAVCCNVHRTCWMEYMATMMLTDDEGKTITEEMEMAFAFGRYKEELNE